MKDALGGGNKTEGTDGSRHLDDAVREFDLGRVARELREEEAWQREGHNARTLVKNESLRIVLIDMHVKGHLKEHQTDSRISIQVLTGKISVRLPGATHVIEAGKLLSIDQSIAHDVEALEPSTFLLTLARSARDAETGAASG